MYCLEIYEDAGRGRDAISDFDSCADIKIILSDDIKYKNHKLFFDNLFCSVALLEHFGKHQIFASGTLR